MSAPMSETASFEVLGSVTEFGNVGPGLRVAVSPDGAQVALVRAAEGGTTGEIVKGPYSLEKIRALAENIVAGNPRAVTLPAAPMVLALFTCSQFLLAERGLREQTGATSPGAAERGADASAAALPPETLAAEQPSLFGRPS